MRFRLVRALHPATRTFGAALALAALGVLAVPVAPELRMRAFHQNGIGYPAWAALQFAPSMYSFENRVWTSDSLASWDDVRTGRAGVSKGYKNHQPVSVAFSEAKKRRHAEGYVYLETVYRRDTLRTRYRVEEGRIALLAR